MTWPGIEPPASHTPGKRSTTGPADAVSLLGNPGMSTEKDTPGDCTA